MCSLKLITTDTDILPCEIRSISIFSLQKSSSSSADFWQVSSSWLSSSSLQIIFQTEQEATKYSYENRSPTLSQLVPATKHETSPPRRFAAVIVFSVMGVRVSLLCSATTNVL